jgi:hypothetical protein
MGIIGSHVDLTSEERRDQSKYLTRAKGIYRQEWRSRMPVAVPVILRVANEKVSRP